MYSVLAARGIAHLHINALLRANIHSAKLAFTRHLYVMRVCRLKKRELGYVHIVSPVYTGDYRIVTVGYGIGVIVTHVRLPKNRALLKTKLCIRFYKKVGNYISSSVSVARAVNYNLAAANFVNMIKSFLYCLGIVVISVTKSAKIKHRNRVFGECEGIWIRIENLVIFNIESIAYSCVFPILTDKAHKLVWEKTCLIVVKRYAVNNEIILSIYLSKQSLTSNYVLILIRHRCFKYAYLRSANVKILVNCSLYGHT